ncbi:MAG: hypothetical protein R3B82_24105 [Sandaracinaceae bacterium]
MREAANRRKLLGEEGSNTLESIEEGLDDRVASTPMTRAGSPISGSWSRSSRPRRPPAVAGPPALAPWVDGEGVPIVRMFTGDEPAEGGWRSRRVAR